MNNRGFTIVELAVSIAVIGILAAIVSVSYKGAENRASVAAVEADLKRSVQTAASFKYDNGVFPKTEADVMSTRLKVNKDVYYDSQNFAICSGNSSFGVVGRAKDGKYYSQTSTTKFREYTGTTSMTSSPNICQVVLNDSTTIHYSEWAKTGAGSNTWTELVR